MSSPNDPRKGSPSAGSYAHLNRITDPAIRDALKYLTDHQIQLRQDHDNYVGYVDKPLLTHLNANDKQLKSVMDPVDPQDAVTLTYLRTYVANYATAQGGAAASAGGGTGGAPSPGEATAPNYEAVVTDVWGSLGVTSASTPFQLFKFVQNVVWRISSMQPAGETLVGLLTQTGGDGVYTCNGVTYACFRLCFDNGANIKILTGSFQPQWTQEANIDVADWHAPTDPAVDCP